MDAAASSTTTPNATRARPLWLSVLAIYSVALGIVTGIPQLYYVLYALHVVPIGPHTNLLGQFWYGYVVNGDQGGYIQVDAGTLAGAIEDAFMLAPLYVLTGIGLWRRSRWVVTVGLIAGAMIFYAILYFVLIGILPVKSSAASIITTILSAVPYLLYPLWLIPVLLTRRRLFQPASAG